MKKAECSPATRVALKREQGPLREQIVTQILHRELAAHQHIPASVQASRISMHYNLDRSSCQGGDRLSSFSESVLVEHAIYAIAA